MVKVTQVCFKSSLENLPVTTIKKSKEWSEWGEGDGGKKRRAAAGEKQIKPSKKQASGNKRQTVRLGVREGEREGEV